jgi:hypothetical protein
MRINSDKKIDPEAWLKTGTTTQCTQAQLRRRCHRLLVTRAAMQMKRLCKLLSLSQLLSGI